MRKFSFILLIGLVGFAVSCKTTKSSVSVQGKCETLSQSSERLYTSLATDSLSKFFALNADSLVITFATPSLFPSFSKGGAGVVSLQSASMPSPNDLAGSLDDVYAFSKPPDVKRPTAHPQTTSLKVYGLHTSTGSSKQSIQQSSSADSNDKSEQSAKYEEDNVKKSSPVPLARYILLLAIIAAAIYIIYKVRR